MDSPAPLSRRTLLATLGGGFGALALQALLAEDSRAAENNSAASVLHHPPKARRVLQLFMNGGASQMDTFDYKPELEKQHGQKFDPGERVEAATSTPGNLMKSPFEFQQHGQCGRWVSSALPRLA